ncbi:contactin-associated protein-like 2 [Tubulanus polymorphus]|uniref:contactin-associated protein-like 2 n=1 Tax=Tubulanus polymorphus TaxID=672921 RepID=UPI003DA45E34
MDTYGDLTLPCVGNATEVVDCNSFNCLPNPKTCTEMKQRGMTESNYVNIRPTLNYPSFRVWCDMQSRGGVGVTIINHDSMNWTYVSGYEGSCEYDKEIVYDELIPRRYQYYNLYPLLDQSEHCRQFVGWRCYMTGFLSEKDPNLRVTYWKGRYDVVFKYWGDVTDRSFEGCACGQNGTCTDRKSCNCDMNDAYWRQDGGYLTFKEDLPVTHFCAGDTGQAEDKGQNLQAERGYHQVGPLECWGVDPDYSDI